MLVALWHAAGREGVTAEFLKGLIKLTAAGVKVRQGMSRGVRLHTERAAAHFERVREATGAPRFAGLSLAELVERAGETCAAAEVLVGDPRLRVEVVLPFTLAPQD